MSKSTVLTLVDDMTLGASVGSPVVSSYYDRVVEDLARFPWLTTMSLIPVVAGTSSYQLSNAQAKIIGMFYDRRQLGKLTIAEAESLNRYWRNEQGDPHSYIEEGEAVKTFRLYPSPIFTSKSQVFPNSRPFGIDFPAYTLLVIHTGTRTDLPTWLELPVALEVAARELERESPHRDLEWAQAAHNMASLLFEMVGDR